ncbi:MAG TPA: Asp-tRNA(Asn)/Glu-tRNA(Gln) amidotransferase subunit GatB [Chloroflexi bacterium]|nr:Asp-tRNA(Asn)/Glu-tRNA(Gln) amidotransferase subunit GatB [Chloroflexota bacterium]
MEYEAVIGMEVHVQLLTKSKMFCSCSAEAFGAEPNTHVCPVCLGMPGSLPVINRKAVEYTIMAGLALNCQIAEFAKFDRKNYFYPDLPKGYQISQYDLPIATNGWLEIETENGHKRIRIRRVHLEEDTAKLFHMGDYTLVDFNRAGIPLLEIVSEPDMSTPEEARQYLIKLRTILRYLGISTADMEKGAMRCEANVSLRPKGSKELGTRVEIKNINSFRFVKQALEYEIERQRKLLEQGRSVEQITVGWDDQRNITVVQRTKEYAHDYRYFPEPDLPPLVISREWVEEIRARLPELPDARRERFQQQYGLSPAEARVLTAEKEPADYFEACVALYPEPKKLANWITGEFFRLLRDTGTSFEDVKVSPEKLVKLLRLVDEGTINQNTAKAVLREMFETGEDPQKIVEKKGLSRITDTAYIQSVIEEVLDANPDALQRYLGGKESTFGFFMGQVMKATKGRADPKLASKLLREKLTELKKNS